jgi:hypothetical protein
MSSSRPLWSRDFPSPPLARRATPPRENVGRGEEADGLGGYAHDSLALARFIPSGDGQKEALRFRFRHAMSCSRTRFANASTQESAGLFEIDRTSRTIRAPSLDPASQKGRWRTSNRHSARRRHCPCGRLFEQFESHLIVLDCAQPPDIGEPEIRNRLVINQNISMKILR